MVTLENVLRHCFLRVSHPCGKVTTNIPKEVRGEEIRVTGGWGGSFWITLDRIV